MAAFLPNIPQAGDFLDTTSQPQLLSNNQALDARFGVDHYKYSNATGQSGKHNRVTTPVFVDSPPTGLPPVTIQTEPQFYGFQQTVPFGVMQYSRGWQVAQGATAAPSPLTYVQSPSTGVSLGPQNTMYVMDFTGLTRAIATIYFADFATLGTVLNQGFEVIFWNGTTFDTQFWLFTKALILIRDPVLTNRLLLKNNNTVDSGVTLTSVFFTMQMLRMQ